MHGLGRSHVYRAQVRLGRAQTLTSRHLEFPLLLLPCGPCRARVLMLSLPKPSPRILISTAEVSGPPETASFHDEPRTLLFFTLNSSMLKTKSIKLTKSACFLCSLLTMESRASRSRANAKWWPEPSNNTSDAGRTVCQPSSVFSSVCAHTHTLYALENFKVNSYN